MGNVALVYNDMNKANGALVYNDTNQANAALAHNNRNHFQLIINSCLIIFLLGIYDLSFFTRRFISSEKVFPPSILQQVVAIAVWSKLRTEPPPR